MDDTKARPISRTKKLQILAKALLGTRRIRNQWGGPCWCDTAARLYCVGQPQCKNAKAALEAAGFNPNSLTG